MPMLTSANWHRIVWTGTEFVAIARDSVLTAKSTDGINWTEYSGLPDAYSWKALGWNGSILVAISNAGLATSADGITWTFYSGGSLPMGGAWDDITWNGSIFVAVREGIGSGGNIATSPDGITWTTRTSTNRRYLRVRWNGSRFATHVFTSGSSGIWLHSADGMSGWDASTVSVVGTTGNAYAAGASPGGPHLAVPWNLGTVYILKNDLTVASAAMPYSRRWMAMAFGAARFAVVAAETADAATVSADGLTTLPSTMPISADWNDVAYGNGRFVAICNGTATAVSLDDGATWSLTGPTSAEIEAPTALTLQLPQRAHAATRLDVAHPAGTLIAPTRLAVQATGATGAPATLAVVSLAGGLLAAPRWTARCLIDGADVSGALTGVARVTATEGGARLAELTINPPGGPFAPLDYVGKTLTLDYVPVIAGTPVPLRLFTGRIDTPDYDFDACLLTLSCVDDLQNRVAALDRATLDALIGGRFTEAVQGAIDDHWDYAQACLSTVAASLDAGPHGGLRVTPWESAAVWATFGVGQLIYPRTRVSYPQRSTIVNAVSIEFDYRYPRLRQRYTALGWSGTLIDMAPTGYQYPSQQDILGAAGGSGWIVTDAAFWPAPAAIPHTSGGFVYPAEDAIDMAILKLTQRHSQTVTEEFRLTVQAPESIAANGTLPHSLRGALQSEFDGGAWESALDVPPLMPAGGDMDWSPDATRGDADHALQTLLDQARVKILGSHRSTRVANSTVCNPDIDLDKRIAIATPALDAEGKVVEVVHELDFGAGAATTAFTLGCFGAGGAGIVTPSTLVPPAPPPPAAETQDWRGSVPSLHVCTYGVTPYSENLMGLLLNPSERIFVENVPPNGESASYPNPSYVPGTYPVQGFRVRMPGVDDADRNPIVRHAGASYDVRVPVDTLQITHP